MDDLVAWLRAQLDEDERLARAASAGPWRYDPTKHHRVPGTAIFEEGVFAGPLGSEALCVAATGDSDDPASMADAAFIARHDPARVLCEVEAKRRIIYELGAQASRYRDGDPTTIISPEGRALADQARRYLRLLALPYADRAGYREEWKP